jgi:hypothetical protein
MTAIVVPLAGLLLLTTGYRYYWLIAGGIGFLFGINIVSTPNGGELTTTAVGVGLICGFLAAIASMFITDLALGFIGFFIGGMLIVGLSLSLGWESGSSLVLFIAGGFIGLIGMRYARDYALIFISAVIGAAILLSAIPPLEPEIMNLAFLALVALGCVLQFIMRNKWK